MPYDPLDPASIPLQPGTQSVRTAAALGRAILLLRSGAIQIRASRLLLDASEILDRQDGPPNG